jgi:hypothetical protein
VWILTRQSFLSIVPSRTKTKQWMREGDMEREIAKRSQRSWNRCG